MKIVIILYEKTVKVIEVEREKIVLENLPVL